MKKILVYLSGHIGFKNFAMLKKLQEKTQVKIYVIIDQGNQPKKFFEDQKFVKIEKKWFYSDHVKPFSKPNIKYLKIIENKFGINLWQIAYSDPTFFTFEGKSNFKEEEILSLIENDCKLFEKILGEVNPDFLVIHTGGQKQVNILKEMCTSKQVKILQYGSAKFGLRLQISQKYDILDEFPVIPNRVVDENMTDEFLEELKKELNLTQYYKTVSKKVKNKKIGFVIGTFTNILRIKKESDKLYTNLKQPNMIKRYLKIFRNNLNRNRRKEFLNNHCIKKIQNNEKFVYFPLHMQPEHTTSVVTPFFTDQISLIRNIARSLPVNYFLYVKDHPSMGTMRYWRERKYYEKILDIPNVRLIHPEVNSLSLNKMSQIVFTINGSASTEAILLKKQVIVFADVASMNVESVIKVENLEDLPAIIRDVIGRDFSSTGAKKFFVEKCNETIEHDPSSTLGKNIIEKLFVKGIELPNITEESMKEIFEENRQDIEILANEYLRKISQWEEYEKSGMRPNNNKETNY